MQAVQQRILVVEDEPDIAEVVVFLLEREGYAVDWVSDGFLALKSIAQGVPDLVLTDLMMPIMDGCQLLQRIRAWDGSEAIPVLILSALPDEMVSESCRSANAILQKPFQSGHLLAAVRSLLLTSRDAYTPECAALRS